MRDWFCSFSAVFQIIVCLFCSLKLGETLWEMSHRIIVVPCPGFCLHLPHSQQQWSTSAVKTTTSYRTLKTNLFISAFTFMDYSLLHQMHVMKSSANYFLYYQFKLDLDMLHA